ncbi:MAG: aspartate aminotransferase family protein [Acetobacteraceae bacterium]
MNDVPSSDLRFENSRARIAAARAWLAGGVSSNFRQGVQPTPLVFTHASGPYLYDADGNRLIDYYLGMGPMILGHTPQSVRDAVVAELGRGILYAGQSEIEFEAASRLCALVPCAERVRFASSGSEAVQAAIRLARAATGRTRIVKFEGHYHGWMDNILFSTAPGLQEAGRLDGPNAVPGSLGQDLATAAGVAVLPWNDLVLLEARLAAGDIAAVIMEPAMCNAGAIAPAEGYLVGARRACEANGTLLIFDETITGFRLAPGGAQAYFGVTPHLATFAKAIANGFPVAAIAGRADLLDLFATGRVLHGGTYNAQPPAMAATVATLQAVSRPGFHAAIAAQGERLMDGLRGAFADAAVPAVVTGFGTVFHVAFGLQRPARNWRDLLAMDRARYVAFTTALLGSGVRALERGAWFLSSVHDAGVIDQTLQAVRTALRRL